MGQKRFLDVGSGAVEPPWYFAEWRRDRLDLDPATKPEMLLDARELATLPAATYDAVYCSHNLEHYHRHDAIKVVQGFRHVLKPDGFAEVRVPDLGALMRHVVANNLDIDDVVYHAHGSPILVRDVIYGYHVEIEKTGQEFYLHKTGFTPKSLARIMGDNGFVYQAIRQGGLPIEIRGWFFTNPPTDEVKKWIDGLPA